MEELERRRLLSVSFAAGIVRVIGTAGNDAITVDADGGVARLVVQDNASVRRFNTADVQMVLIDGRDGDDTISLTPAVTLPSQVYGEGGNDRLNGGAGRDALFGGDGGDRFYGGGGNDTLSGGNGRDVLKGQGGRDRMLGDDGNDNLVGSAGKDTLIGGNGNDYLEGMRAMMFCLALPARTL